MAQQTADHVDVLIIGAGLSGIGAAAHLEMELPDRRYAILDMREAIGGTWDLFRYPGVRSDSDMHTLGYRFNPWPSDRVLADGPSIRDYVEATAEKYSVTGKIRFGHKVVRSSWDSATARWTVEYEHDGERGTLTTDFVWNCSGYYDYENAYTPTFPGVEDFAGQVIHPQFWPEDLDYAGKKVVVIGSGATAVTLVPAMADEAEHVTMLQRTPTYMMSIPSNDPLGRQLRRVMPRKVAAHLTRWRNVGLQAALYQASQRMPDVVRKGIRKATVAQLPEGYDVDTHFKPPYDPWDQRMCMLADGDLFKAIRRGDASVVTGAVERFEAGGIRVSDGSLVEADIVITATGLSMLAFGGQELVVDGEPVTLSDTVAYRGVMLSGVPNFAYVVGYTNASWTLKADLVSEWVVRLLKTMDKRGADQVAPQKDPSVPLQPLMGLESGYVKRAIDRFPKAGTTGPWQVPQNYFRDIVGLRTSKIEESSLRFSA